MCDNQTTVYIHIRIYILYIYIYYIIYIIYLLIIGQLHVAEAAQPVLAYWAQTEKKRESKDKGQPTENEPSEGDTWNHKGHVGGGRGVELMSYING